MNSKFAIMTLTDFTNLLEHLPPDTRIAGPVHLPDTTTVWATSDDAGESATYVVSGESVCRVSDRDVTEQENCYEKLLRTLRDDAT